LPASFVLMGPHELHLAISKSENLLASTAAQPIALYR
jgi:hypothetical protein